MLTTDLVRASLALVLLGCDGLTQQGRCDEYASQPTAYGVCARAWAVDAKDAEELERICASIDPEYQAGCRLGWVEHRIRGATYSRDTLLAACGPENDCQLRVVDTRPDPDLLVQLDLCRQTGTFAGDCRGHAYQRWAVQVPSTDEIARVLAASSPNDTHMGHTLGFLAACHGGAPCPETDGYRGSECRRAVQTFTANPTACTVRPPAQRSIR